MPVSAYLIEHPKGLILVDTGWNKVIRESNWKELGFQSIVNTGYLPAGDAIDEQLEHLGYKTTDLDYVLMSHLHCDHASGLQLVKNAKKIMVSKKELIQANKQKMIYLTNEWQGIDFTTYDFESMPIGPFNQAYDLFGDGSIINVFAPGHSVGMAITLVKGSDGKYVILAADAGYGKRAWEQMIIPQICVSKKDAIMSLGWVRKMASSSDCIECLANHDIDVTPHTIELNY